METEKEVMEETMEKDMEFEVDVDQQLSAPVTEEMDLTFPMYLSWKKGVIEVLGYVDNTDPDDFIDGKGYISDGIVFQYHKKKPKNVTSPVPYFYVRDFSIGSVDMSQKVMKFPLSREESVKEFGVKRMIDWSYSRILNETRGDEVLYNEEMLNDMNTARSVYVPDIRADDDCLKKLVKYTILKKKVDINRYKSVMETPYALTNMKSALISKTKMSITYFLMWVELLGIDFAIAIQDNGRDQDPLEEGLLYRSKDNSIYTFDPKKNMLSVVERTEEAQKAMSSSSKVIFKINETYRTTEEEESDVEEESEEE